MSDTQELQVSNQNTEIQKIIGGNPDVLFAKPELLKPLAKHIEAEIEGFKYDLSTDTSRRAIITFANKINKTRVAIDKTGKELNREILKQRDANNEFIAKAAEILDPLRDKAKKPLTDWEIEEKAKDERRQKVLAEIKILGNSGLDDTSDQIVERLNTIKAMDFDEMDMGDFLETAKERRENAIAFLKSTYIRVKQAEDNAAELARLKAEQVEADRVREVERKELEVLRAKLAAKEPTRDPVSVIQDAVEQVPVTNTPKTAETAPATPVSTPTADYDVGDADADVEDYRDQRLTEIIAVLSARGLLELHDAERIGEMLFKGEVPHMELV